MKDSALDNGRKRAGIPYWYTEQPQTFATSFNVFRFYKNAFKVSVSLPDFPDKTTGEVRMGKTIVIDLDALIESPAALKALLEILCTARDKVDRETWQALK